MFGWFKAYEKQNEIKKCSMCGLYETVKSDMGDEFCFVCLCKRVKMVLNMQDNHLERSNREDLDCFMKECNIEPYICGMDGHLCSNHQKTCEWDYYCKKHTEIRCSE